MIMRTCHHVGICLLAILLWCSAISFAAPPSPKAKQLHIGQLTYFSDIWTNATARNFFANHYSWTVFDYGVSSRSTIASYLAAMKAINPSFKAFKYTLFNIRMNKGAADYLPDTSDIRTQANALGLSYDSLFVWTGSRSSDSVRCRNNPYTGVWASTGPNSIIRVSFFGQDRASLDFRNPDVGKALGRYWATTAASYGCDGVMTDEECPLGRTGILTDWYYPTIPPFFRPHSTAYWAVGSPFTTWRKPWGSALTDEQVGDSMRALRSGWMKIAGDTLRNRNMEYLPNWSANGGPIGSSSHFNFENEVRHTIVGYTKSALLGEYCGYYPSMNLYQNMSCEYACNRLVQACQSVKDSAVSMYIWPISIGVLDSTAANDPGMTTARTRLNALGFMLECLWPGSSTYKFGPCSWGGAGADNQFLMNHYIGGRTVNDTLVDWSEAWGKYFGYPAPATRRDSTLRGTDGAGQAYTIHRMALASQATATDTLTFVVGRYCRGTNTSATSAVNVTLPAGTWSQVNDNGTWTAVSSPVSIRNGEWKVLSSNVTLANNGPGATSLSVLQLSPNGGERWPVGSTQTITWSASGTYSNVLIELSRDGGTSWSTLTNLASSSATSWSWTVPTPCADNAKIRVTLSGSQGTVTDASDQNFAIVYNSPGLSSPSDGATGITGTSSFIWSAVPSATGYRFMVSNSSGFTGAQVAYQDISGTSSTLSATWTSGSIPFQNGTTYYWRVLANPSASCTNVSWSTTRRFTYQGTPTLSVAVTSPNGNERWSVGSVQLLTWSATGTYSNVLIELSRDGGTVWSTLTNLASSTATSWSWTVPAPCADNAKIRVTLSGTQGTVSDASDQNFAIVYAAPALNAPVDGSTIVGATTTFSWSSIPNATGYRFMVSSNSSFSGGQTAYLDLTATTATLSTTWTSGSIVFQSGTTYYWRVLANPSAPCTNVAWSTSRRFTYQGTAPQDSIPPDTVHWLNYVPGANDGEIDLTWIAPGDDGLIGEANAYDLRYADQPFTAADWDLLPSYPGFPSPLPGGSQQTATLQGLVPGTTYYVCVKTSDLAGNISPPSRIISTQAKKPLSTGGGDIPLVPALPADFAVVHSSHPLLSVTNPDTASITAYYFDVSLDSLFSDMAASSPSVARQPGPVTSWEVSERLSSNRLYFWRATADRLNYSPLRRFSIETIPHVYPNPYEPARTPQAVFTELPQKTNLFLMTVTGTPVRFLTSTGGEDIVWDGTNESGHAVASGTYLWYIEGTDFRGKLIIIR
jgi:hypothetical protein